MRQTTELPKRFLLAGEDFPVPAGALDGVTIMRYAHVDRRRASGGVEQYLRLLHRGLLQRHRLTVVQMHLTDDADDQIEIENVGIGIILWVPVAFRQTNSPLADLPRRIGCIYGRSRRLCSEGVQLQYRTILHCTHNLLRRYCEHLRYKTAIFSDCLADLLVKRHVDLLVLHWLTYDTRTLISQALKTETPFVFINHFDNTRLSLPGTQECLAQAAGIGVVSSRGIPDTLGRRCVNLSDAVDTEFFTPDKARPAAPRRPIVLLPARIQAGKGHHDLIDAARILIARKIDLALYFAGAVDSEPLHQELRRLSVATGLSDSVLFLGERTAEEIRELYAASDIVVLPSYTEGLPRVLIEAQAMKKPVVAYDSGGVRDAILPNETGILVKTGDVKSLADKISFLIDNEAERLSIGERGRDFVCRQFSSSALVRRHEDFYLRALSGAFTKDL